jgi:ribonuclease P/MRP protein subunit RPP1
LGYFGFAYNYEVVKAQPHDATIFNDVPSNIETNNLPMGSSRVGQPLKRYKRITVVFSEVAQTRTLTHTTNPALNSFDVIAVVPQDEKTFNIACTSLDIDIIVIPTTCKLPYILRLPTVRSAIARGIHFEVSLGASLRDTDNRYNLFANLTALVRATNGRSILLSGGGTNPTELRAPNDIANVCSLCGLDFATAKASLSSAPLSIINRGFARKASRGVITVKEGTSTIPDWEPAPSKKDKDKKLDTMKM